MIPGIPTDLFFPTMVEDQLPSRSLKMWVADEQEHCVSGQFASFHFIISLLFHNIHP